MRFCLRAPAQSIRRIARELQIRKSDTLNKDLIGADSQWRLEIGSAAVRDEVILFDSVANGGDRKSTRLNSSHVRISYAVFCLKKKKQTYLRPLMPCAAKTEQRASTART